MGVSNSLTLCCVRTEGRFLWGGNTRKLRPRDLRGDKWGGWEFMFFKGGVAWQARIFAGCHGLSNIFLSTRRATENKTEMAVGSLGRKPILNALWNPSRGSGLGAGRWVLHYQDIPLLVMGLAGRTLHRKPVGGCGRPSEGMHRIGFDPSGRPSTRSLCGMLLGQRINRTRCCIGMEFSGRNRRLFESAVCSDGVLISVAT